MFLLRVRVFGRIVRLRGVAQLLLGVEQLAAQLDELGGERLGLAQRPLERVRLALGGRSQRVQRGAGVARRRRHARRERPRRRDALLVEVNLWI